MRTSQHLTSSASRPAGTTSAPAAKTPALSANILQLQKTLGNRATRQLLQARTIQRDVENDTYNDEDMDNMSKAKKFFDSFDAAAKKAYNYVLSVPSLGGYANLNGYTELWVTKWNKYLRGEKVDLMAATFGYVIESLVCEGASEFYPGAPADCSVAAQVTSGGTRPDLVLRLTNGTKDIAWLDLTASKSADHIFDKDGWKEKVKIFAEVTYPSLDPGSLSFMVQNKDNQGELDAEEVKKRIEKARKDYEKRKAQWIELGKNFKFSKLSGKIGRSRMDQELDNSIRRNFIRKTLVDFFKVDIEEKMVPSILAALGVDSTSWHFRIGYSESERAGETWLVDHAPAQIEE